MDTMSSAEFRRRYASILRPTVVTANGHPIGIWQPYKGSVDNENMWRKALGSESFPNEVVPRAAREEFGLPPIADRFNTRPFTPVPKTRK